MDKIVDINGFSVHLTNLDKVYWPGEGYTKGDLVKYYEQVSEYILPYLKDRPMSINRYPHGIEGQSFYQKNVEKHPDWVKTYSIFSGSKGEEINYLVCNDLQTLLYVANLGSIEMHVWNSRVASLDTPDYLVIDLDPESIDFDSVVVTALEVKKLCDSVGVSSYPKTSGATGLHIYIPMGGKYPYSEVRQFAQIIATIVNSRNPEITSLRRSPMKRQGKVYIDYLQNTKGATMAAPFCVRPFPGAPVSMPLRWSEVRKGLKNSDFTIEKVLKRLKSMSDIFEPVLGDPVNISNVLISLEKLDKA